MALTDLPTVGPATAANLKEAGYPNKRSLRGVAPEQLAQVDGIGVNSAEKIVAAVTFGETGVFDPMSLGSGPDDNVLGIGEFESVGGDVLRFQMRGRNDPAARAGGETRVEIEPADAPRGQATVIGEFGFLDDALATTNEMLGGFGQAQELHEERPKQERAVDESLRAETTTDLQKWRSDMDSYDYPGVDTPHSTERL